MAELHFYKKGKAVRLTDQAHALLAEKAEDSNISQKEIASEAILMLHKRENKDRELRAARANVIRLEERIRDEKLLALGTFLLGTVIGGALIFAILVGVLW